jgi:3-dehydroquinate synthase
VERGTLLIALGGGVIGDLTGFVASILLRGVPCVQVPTTVLAQVDSSVGGKTAINSKSGKNLIGSFCQPKLVVIDPNILQTLPDRHIRAGLAETLKYGAIRDGGFFDELHARTTADDIRLQGKGMAEMIRRACQHKADIVAEDEKEAGIRALLNYGHTLAHALETMSGYNPDVLLHGEAVAIGMVFAAELSENLSYCMKGTADHLRHIFTYAGLPIDCKALENYVFTPDDLITLMKKDKKASDNTLTFVLLRGIGEAIVVKSVPEIVVRSTLERFLAV